MHCSVAIVCFVQSAFCYTLKFNFVLFRTKDGRRTVETCFQKVSFIFLNSKTGSTVKLGKLRSIKNAFVLKATFCKFKLMFFFLLFLTGFNDFTITPAEIIHAFSWRLNYGRLVNMGNWPLDRSPKAHLKNRTIICKNGFSFARSLNGIVSESRNNAH